jgi:hypothetical protein
MIQIIAMSLLFISFRAQAQSPQIIHETPEKMAISQQILEAMAKKAGNDPKVLAEMARKAEQDPKYLESFMTETQKRRLKAITNAEERSKEKVNESEKEK